MLLFSGMRCTLVSFWVCCSQVLTSACGHAQLLGNFTQGFMGIDHVLFTYQTVDSRRKDWTAIPGFG